MCQCEAALSLGICLTFVLLSPTLIVFGFRIESPDLTTWGSWGPWDDCHHGTFVNGMRLKVEDELDRGIYNEVDPTDDKDNDDTGLNGLELFCSDGESREARKNITSSQGSWGVWGNSFHCKGNQKVIGFQLRIERPLGIDGDDTATNNIRLYCEDKTFIQGDGLNRGNWTQQIFCPRFQFICGLRTQVQGYQGSDQEDDDTALNQIHMDCCNPFTPIRGFE